MNKLCEQCHRLNNGCKGTENDAYTGCVHYIMKREIIDYHTEGVWLTKWIKRNRSMDYLKDIAECRKYTSLTYRGVSEENPDYFIFSDVWSKKNIEKMKEAEYFISLKIW